MQLFADRICLSTLCERALSFTVSLREEGQVELLVETPNGLGAGGVWQTATESVNTIFQESRKNT